MKEREKESKLAELWDEAKENCIVNKTGFAFPVIFAGYLIKYAYESMRDFLYSRMR